MWKLGLWPRNSFSGNIIPFLRIFVSNFRYWFFAVQLTEVSLSLVSYGGHLSLWTLSAKPTGDSISHDEIAGFSRHSRLSRLNSGLKQLHCLLMYGLNKYTNLSKDAKNNEHQWAAEKGLAAPGWDFTRLCFQAGLQIHPTYTTPTPFPTPNNAMLTNGLQGTRS